MKDFLRICTPRGRLSRVHGCCQHLLAVPSEPIRIIVPLRGGSEPTVTVGESWLSGAVGVAGCTGDRGADQSERQMATSAPVPAVAGSSAYGPGSPAKGVHQFAADRPPTAGSSDARALTTLPAM